jgi:hypothetical protein
MAGPRPWVAFLAGLVCHAVLDMVPHHDYRKVGQALLDLALALTLALLLFRGPAAWARWWGGLGGALPDLEVAIGHLVLSTGRPWRWSRFPTHTGALPHPRWPLPQGLWSQLVPAILAILWLAR